MRGVFDGARLRRDRHAGARVRGGAARGDAAAAEARVQAVRRAGQRARAALGHDDPDRARGRDPLRDREPPLRFCYVAHAYRSVRAAARPAARDAAGGDRARRRARARGHGGGAGGAVRGARRRRACENYRIGLGDASLYPALLDAARRAGAGRAAAILHELVTRDFVGLEREVEGLRLGGEATAAAARACRSCAAAPEVLERAGRRRAATGLRAVLELLAGRRARARDLRPRPRARRSATTRARCSRSTTPRSAPRSAAAAATTTCSAASAATCPACGWALNVERLHIARVGGARRAAMSPAADGWRCRAGALFGDTLDLLDALGVDTPRCARTTASCCSRTPG